MTAVRCAHRLCRRTTRDSSGRCHDHRAAPADAGAGRTLPRPSRAIEKWRSGTGVPHPFGGYDTVKDFAGARSYHLDEKLHREDGPATERAEIRQWFVHGELHREGGPAVEQSDGSYEYRTKGARHRLDGPAVFAAGFGDGADEGDYFEWHIEGQRLGVTGFLEAIGRPLPEGIPTKEVDRLASTGAIDVERLREGLASGAPYEWARAYAEGEFA